MYLLFEDDLGSALSVEPIASLVWHHGAHGLAYTVEGVDTREALLGVVLADALVAAAQGRHEPEQRTLCLVADLHGGTCRVLGRLQTQTNQYL